MKQAKYSIIEYWKTNLYHIYIMDNYRAIRKYDNEKKRKDDNVKSPLKWIWRV